MLTRLSIRDVVLIAAVDLDFGDGLTVLTGETGAGKSILLDGLGLVLGNRADASLVRSGAAQAVVSASFAVPGDHPVRTALAEQGLDADDDEISLRRMLKKDGGSRAFINDIGVSATLLRDVGRLLVEIHGQHDERGLLSPRGHRALLDAFGGLQAQAAGVETAWAAVTAARQRLTDAEETLANAARDRDWLHHAVAELTSLKPKPGEEAELAERRQLMQKGAKLGEELDQIDDLLSGSNGALTCLRQASRRLERIADAHEGFAAAVAAIDRMLVEADEAERGLADARDALAFSPDDLEAVESRLFELRGMARKHRVEPDALAALAEELAGRAAAIDAGEEGLVGLRKAVASAEAAYRTAAESLSKARRSVAAKLDKSVNTELPALRLDAARFRTALQPAEPGPTGIDSVAFEVATNAGTDFGPLTKIASGGELSRFVLALKVALAATGTAGTLIFDEIDRGVGGATASAIGGRLARVADATQVVVVTHSPQVAASGAHHLQIAKSVVNGSTRTAVRPLDTDERIEEIARMLSGEHVSAEARAQAGRLLGVTQPGLL